MSKVLPKSGLPAKSKTVSTNPVSTLYQPWESRSLVLTLQSLAKTALSLTLRGGKACWSTHPAKPRLLDAICATISVILPAHCSPSHLRRPRDFAACSPVCSAGLLEDFLLIVRRQDCCQEGTLAQAVRTEDQHPSVGSFQRSALAKYPPRHGISNPTFLLAG